MGLEKARFRLAIGTVAFAATIMLLVPRARAYEISSSVDVGFTLTVEQDGDEKSYSRELPVDADLEYDGQLNALYELDMKISGGYTVNAKSDSPDTRNTDATFDLKLSGPTVEFSYTYSGKKDNTEATIDEGETNQFSSDYIAELNTDLDYFPEMKIKWQHKRDFESGVQEKIDNKIDLDLSYELEDLNADFKMSRELVDSVYPDGTQEEKTTWQLTLSYGREFFNELIDLQLDYDIKEDISDYNDAPTSKSFTHVLKGSVKSDFDLSPGVEVDISYDYQFDQDLVASEALSAYGLSEYSYIVGQKLSVGLRAELNHWIDSELKYEGVSERYGSDIETQADNKVSGSLTMKPWDWLDFETKGEGLLNTALEEGGTVSDKKSYKYENNLSAELTDDLNFKANNSYEESYTEGLLEKKTTKYKFDAEFESTPHMTVSGIYNVELNESWDVSRAVSTFEERTRNWDVQFKFSFDREFADILEVRAEHSYSFKHEQTQTSSLDLSESQSLDEDSKLGFKLQNIIRDLTLEVELTRKASDTDGDEEPLIVDRTLSIKGEWDIDDFTLSADYKYDNLGDADDTLTITSRVAYRQEQYEITGEYQFNKTFSDVIDTSNKYNLKFQMDF